MAGSSQQNLGKRVMGTPHSALEFIFTGEPSYDSGGYGAGAPSVAVNDVNGDGKPDLLVAIVCGDQNCDNGGLSVLLGNGDGTFQARVTYGSGGYGALSLGVRDVNGDGKPDLLVANLCANSSSCLNGSVGVLLGNGDGTFQAAVSYNSGGNEPRSVVVADVNGDGKPDLLVANDCVSSSSCLNGSVAALLGNGDGTFQAAVTYGSGGEDAVSVAVADVNGDGKPDLLVANECANGNCDNNSVSVLLGNGDGTFRAAVTYGSGGEFALSVSVADVNGDGKPDLLVSNDCVSSSNCLNGSVAVLRGNGDGTFQVAVSYGSGGEYHPSVAVADVNGDGKPDLLVSSECAGNSNCANGGVGVLVGVGDGTFRAVVTYNSGGSASRSVAVADANGDGKSDLLVANDCGVQNCDNSSVSVLLGNGDGTFQAAVTYGSGGEPGVSVAVADVNGDGKADLLVAQMAGECDPSGSCDGSVGVLLGNGDGTFQTAVTYRSAGVNSRSVAVADVNRDGKPDLLVANQDGGVGMLLGNGDGTFQAALSYGSGGAVAVSVAVADVNGDGKPDLLVANECVSSSNCDTGGVGVLVGNGDGTFQAAVTYGSGGAGGLSVAVADVNGDGKPDLLVANDCGNSNNCANGSVGVLLGNGDGTFQAPVTYDSGGEDAASVAVADVNGDGKPDLLVANDCAYNRICNNSVGVLLGNGDGTFQAVATIALPGHLLDTCTGFDPCGGLALADFNGDGKVDVVSSAAGVLLLGNGDGAFQSPLTLGTWGESVAVGDFNRDGRPDLVVGGVTVLLNLGVTAAATTTSISPSAPKSYSASQPVTFTARVQHTGPGTPTGQVEFLDSGVVMGVASVSSNGQASLTTTRLAVGVHFVLAHYLGNSNFASSNSLGVHVTVNKANTALALSSSVNPSVPGQSVTFTATIQVHYGGQASGTVTFKDGAKILGSSAASGNSASLTTRGLAIGTHRITATYSGDSNFSGSTSRTLSQVVAKAATTTTLVSSINPSVSGKSVGFTATVSSAAGTLTGQGTFRNGTTVLATLTLKSGSAKYTTAELPPGSYVITAVYSGDFNDSGSTSPPLNQFVQAPTTAIRMSSKIPSAYGKTVVFTAMVKSSIGAPPRNGRPYLERKVKWRLREPLHIDARVGHESGHSGMRRRFELRREYVDGTTLLKTWP